MNRSNDKWNANMNSLQGYILVANPHQLDPDFIEAVVLVVEHDDRGAMGVIVNCPRDQHERTSPHEVPSGVGRRNRGCTSVDR